MRGIHIAMEGIDGSGLTTHSKRLVNNLQLRGYNAVYVKEPTSGPIGSLIRGFLSRDREPDHELMALLFAADRRWNYFVSENSISKMLERGYIVVSDRYKYSSIAYQGAFTDVNWVWNVNSKVPHSDIIIYLDIPVMIAIRRVLSRSKNGVPLEIYEKERYLRRIKETYEIVLDLEERQGVHVRRVSMVRGGLERSIEEVEAEILSIILDFVSDSS